MRSFINKILFRLFGFIGKPELINRFCFDLSNTRDKEFWKTGNRTFLSSGKYINGKKHGEFRKYDSEGNFVDWEIYEEGKLLIKVPHSC
jgi:antitoxin component YwqK of YwqJK toxin-antitoxin module